MRNELRCFMEPSKAIFCFKKNPNSQEQKGGFYAYSAFEMIPCILRVEKKNKVSSPLDEKIERNGGEWEIERKQWNQM